MEDEMAAANNIVEEGDGDGEEEVEEEVEVEAEVGEVEDELRRSWGGAEEELEEVGRNGGGMVKDMNQTKPTRP